MSQRIRSETCRRRLLMRIEDAHFALYLGDRREARATLLAARDWLQANPEDRRLRATCDGLREALVPGILKSR